MTDFIFVYITTTSEEEAYRIGRVLVDEKLAACVNIIPGMHSIYRWQGSLEEAQEVVCIAKTMRAQFDGVESRVKSMHSSENPCIIALPVEMGSEDFLSWLKRSVFGA